MCDYRGQRLYRQIKKWDDSERSLRDELVLELKFAPSLCLKLRNTQSITAVCRLYDVTNFKVTKLYTPKKDEFLVG